MKIQNPPALTEFQIFALKGEIANLEAKAKQAESVHNWTRLERAIDRKDALELATDRAIYGEPLSVADWKAIQRVIPSFPWPFSNT